MESDRGLPGKEAIRFLGFQEGGKIFTSIANHLPLVTSLQNSNIPLQLAWLSMTGLHVHKEGAVDQ
eukprot:1149834-Pelagomonas_calceolata.AAC.4